VVKLETQQISELIQIVHNVQNRITDTQKKIIEVTEGAHQKTVESDRALHESILALIDVLDLAERLDAGRESPELKRVIQRCQTNIKRLKTQEILVDRVTPHFVRVIETRPHDTMSPGAIIQISRKGYQRDGKILRPVDVISVEERLS
jgi:molecular chaperone GrpE (heat shock protein)